MRELNRSEVRGVSGGLKAEDGAYAILGLAVLGGPFTAAFGITVGLGLLFYADEE